MSDKNILVATYGSLRHGMGNFGTNIRAGAEYVGRGRTLVPYRLCEYGGGSFPAISLTLPCDADALIIDVFATDEVGLHRNYDTLEGYRRDQPEYSFYNRTLVPIIMDDGTEREAWIYHIDDYEGSVVVKDGDWVRHVNERS